MIHCIVVDDDLQAVQLLSDHIGKTKELLLIGTYESSIEALKVIKEGLNPQLIFMDTNIPNLSGIELAKLVPITVGIVYVTAHYEQAFETFETNVFDFMLKPVSFPRFLKSVFKIKRLLEKTVLPTAASKYVFFNPGVKGKMVKLELNDIIYIEALKNYVILHVNTGKHITYLSMQEIEHSFPIHKFMRIHKSFIINLKYIQCLEGNIIILNNLQKIPIGALYKDAVINYIAQLSVLSKR